MRRATLRIWLAICLAIALLYSTTFGVAEASSDKGEPSEGGAKPVGELPAGSGGRTEVPVGGNVKLDHLGPTIVSEEGEIKRIQNWDKLTKEEQDTAWRRIQKRNTERLAKLRKQGQEGDRFDTTLGGIDEVKTPEERAAKAAEHLKKFRDGLKKLQKSGTTIPGFEGIEEVLKGPSKRGAGGQEVDANKLRQRLEELRKNTDKLRKQGIFHDEL